MTYRTVDSTFYGDPTTDASAVWNRVIDDALRLTDDDFMLVTWKHRYSRFKLPINPIPPYVKFDFLPSRMSYLVKDFVIAGNKGALNDVLAVAMVGVVDALALRFSPCLSARSALRPQHVVGVQVDLLAQCAAVVVASAYDDRDVA